MFRCISFLSQIPLMWWKSNRVIVLWRFIKNMTSAWKKCQQSLLQSAGTRSHLITFIEILNIYNIFEFWILCLSITTCGPVKRGVWLHQLPWFSCYLRYVALSMSLSLVVVGPLRVEINDSRWPVADALHSQ